MKQYAFLSAIAVAVSLAGPAQAACFADYKAKRGNPLQLHYGVIQIDITPCAMSNKAKGAVAARLKSSGWTLLQVQSVFEDNGLGKRKKDAGKFFLRY